MEKVKKVCSKCASEKELSEFNKRSTSKYSYRSDCRECQKTHYKDKSVYYKEKMKQNRLDKLDEYVERDKIYYKENKDKILKSKSEYYIDNRSEILENKRQYHIDNRGIRSEYNKKWREENKELVRTYMRKYVKQYRIKNPHIISWRRVLSCSLIRLGKTKEGHTIDLLGYSATELKEHIESLFTDGMSWENHGEWHIDHIINVSTFNPNTQPSIVNALSNLRPLWATTREINGIVYEGNLNRHKFTS